MSMYHAILVTLLLFSLVPTTKQFTHLLPTSQVRLVPNFLSPTFTTSGTSSAPISARYTRSSIRSLSTTLFANFCHNCGSSLQPSSKFCSSCGTSLSTDSSPPPPLPPPPPPPPPTFDLSQTLEAFITEDFIDHRRQTVSFNTFRTESGFWFDQHGMLATIGATLLSSLASPSGAALAFESHLLSMHSRENSPRTQALHRSAYLAALKHMHYTSKLPTLPEIRPIRVRRADQLPITPFTANEVERLLSFSSSPLHRALFALTVGVGLRPSESLAARWEDFDFEKSVVKIRGTKTSSSAASIPLTALAQREMMAYQKLLQVSHK